MDAMRYYDSDCGYAAVSFAKLLNQLSMTYMTYMVIRLVVIVTSKILMASEM